MDILCTPLYEKQLKVILEDFSKEDLAATKNFKMYLDTIIINIPTKAKKYKPSRIVEDSGIQEVEHQGFLIPFYYDITEDNYIIIAIYKK